MTMRCMVTGASGFVGSALISRLVATGKDVVATSRRRMALSVPVVEAPSFSDMQPLQAYLKDIDVLIHCAARVHVMDEQSSDPLAEFREVNVEGTLNLARKAAAAGVRRFVFISSIKVNGEQTDDRPPFTPEDAPAPEDPYGISKREAEDGLLALAQGTGMEVVVIRPPLVYGPGVKGNFRSLIKLAGLPLPLPLGGINNRRSLVYLGNLVDFILHAAEHPAAANETFLVSDGVDLSTTDLLRSLRKALGRPWLLVPIPGRWLWKATELLGRGNIGQRLCGSLQVDISKNERLLGWKSPYSVAEGLAETVAGFRGNRGPSTGSGQAGTK